VTRTNSQHCKTEHDFKLKDATRLSCNPASKNTGSRVALDTANEMTRRFTCPRVLSRPDDGAIVTGRFPPLRDADVRAVEAPASRVERFARLRFPTSLSEKPGRPNGSRRAGGAINYLRKDTSKRRQS
jgi:hypothetical protein